MIYLASLVEETSDKVEGYKIIHTKKDLDKVVTDNLKNHKVIIRSDFAHEFFTPTGLELYIDQVKRININIVIELDMDNSTLTYSRMLSKFRKCTDINEVVELAIAHSKEFLNTMNFLIDRLDQDNSKVLEYSNQVARLQSVIDQQVREIQDKNYVIAQETSNKLGYQNQLHALVSRINYQYGKGVDTSKLFVVDKNTYDKVLYIKEYSRVQYVDTFIYYLKEILKISYGMPVRTLIVESYYGESIVDMYPNYKPHYSLIEKDVLSGDILMLGMQPNLMQDILKNPSNISVLIILDRGKFSVPHIRGDNVEMLYTFSDLRDKPDWIPSGRCISYEKDTLYIPKIRNFDELDSSQKIGKYSSLDIMKSVISLLERR